MSPIKQPIDIDNRSTSSGQESQGAIDEHLRWTRQRTLLANERNFHGWIRTGLTAEAARLGVARLLHSTGWVSVSTALAGGVVLVIAGATMFLLALRRYWLINQELKQTGIKETTPNWVMTVLIGVLVLSTILALGLLFHE